MTAKLIILSGKMGCGKTDLIGHLKNKFQLFPAMCKDVLHPIVMTFFNVRWEKYWETYHDRLAKETPDPAFAVSKEAAEHLCEIIGRITYSGDWTGIDEIPLTIREAMIYTSECVMKPTFGHDIFGRRRVDLIKGGVYYDDSYGFLQELHPAIKKLGQENILCLRISGRGDDKQDSREILPDGVLENVVDIWNGDDVTLNEFFEKSENSVRDFICSK